VAKRRRRWRAVNQFWKWIARKRVQTALVGGRHLGSGKPSPLTRGWRKRSWLLAMHRALLGTARGATGDVRDHSRGADREDNPWPVRDSDGIPDAPAFERTQERHTAARDVEAVPAPSSAGQPGQHRRKAVWRRKGDAFGSSERQAPCGCVAQAARPEVERSTGARVVGRLQKSGRSILLVFDEGSREANRGDAGQHGAAPSPSTGAGQSDAVGESRRSADVRAGRKGATKLRGNVTGNAKPTHSVSRPRLEPTEGALGCFLRRL
jgi:hypothetical protein